MVDQKNGEDDTVKQTGLPNRVWQFLNKFSEPGSSLDHRQLKMIDGLRRRYPPGSLAQESLDIFDRRTGVAERNARILREALEARKSGDIKRVGEIMSQLNRQNSS